MVVAGAVIVGIVLFGVVVGFGTLAVRLLRLPADPPEEAAFEPASPALVSESEPGAARERAAAWQASAALGRRARSVLLAARNTAEIAEWVALGKPASAAAARAAAGLAASAAEQARHAYTAGDVTALAAAELAGSTAAAQVAAMTEGLPDWQAAERRKLLLLTGALVFALVLAAVTMCLR